MISSATIIESLDAAIAELQPELDRLKAARLALTVAPSSAPPSEAPQRVERRKVAHRQKQSRRPKLTVGDCIDAVRDAIADGPKTVWAIHKDLGRMQSTNSGNVVRQALEQLGAEKTRQGWVLPRASESAAPPATSNGNAPTPPPMDEVEQSYAQRRILRALELGPRPVGGIAKEIDAPLATVRNVCEELVTAGAVERWSDGSFGLVAA